MSEIKLKTARTLKWNGIDRFASQILYGITGVILANLLPQEDFGLVGAILVFQSFAIIFVDSGFGAALLQKHSPTERDYSTVFWFNLTASILIYILLFLCAPGIADIFQKDQRLIPMSRVMFLTFIINGLSIVQTNRLMKLMNVKMIAISDVVGLAISGAAGITLAISGAGAWALVWQSVILASVKTTWLWITGGWFPKAVFSRESLRQIYRVGLGVFTGSFLNTLFLNIYSFVIGAWYSLVALGVYTQADKWSKMGSASISQILTSSFVPVLAKYQNDRDSYRRVVSRIDRFTAFIVFPFMGVLILAAGPIFHVLFGNKWDTAIPLFQILCARGILTVLISLCTNYLLSLGYARSLVIVEVVKDVAVLVAILLTIRTGSVEVLVWGQLAASALTYLFVLLYTCRAIGLSPFRTLSDLAPFAILTFVSMAIAAVPSYFLSSAWLLLFVQSILMLGLYVLVLYLTRNRELREGASYAFGRFTST